VKPAQIRKAERNEAQILTELSLASKRHWDYPEKYFKIWQSELTITVDYLSNHNVFVYEFEDCIFAYYSLMTLAEDQLVGKVVIPAGTWLEHMFVHPEKIGKTIGAQLFNHMINVAGNERIRQIQILADPHSRYFYEKMGCRYIKEFPSSISGRTTPYLIFRLEED